MSTATPAPRPAAVPPPHRNEIRIVSHSNLFYWWPVWAVGFLMALITLMTPTRAVIVPAGELHGKTPAGQKVELKNIDPEKSLHVSSSKNLGVLFAVVLLLVIAITN